MATKFRFRFVGPNSGDQFFDFAESLQFDLRKMGTAHVENLDTIKDEFFVVVKKQRDLGQVEDRIRRAIESARQWIHIEVERV